MRAFALAAVLLAAVAASAGASELIRFRTAEGVLGLVDEEEKVPPGATILSREPKTPRSAPPAGAPEPPRAPARRFEGAAEGARRAAPGQPPASPLEPAPADEATGDEPAAVAAWCASGHERRQARERAEAQLEAAQERYERCRYATQYCSNREVEAAETRLADALADEEDLVDACRRADCLPGWIRDGCDGLP